MLSDDLRELALERAHRSHVSLGELIRNALRRELVGSDAQADPFLADPRVFNGKTPSDVAAQHDDYLYGDKA